MNTDGDTVELPPQSMKELIAMKTAPGKEPANDTHKHATLIEALLAAQAEFAPALKTAVNPHFKSRYVDLLGAYEACQGALAHNGIVIIQTTKYRDGVTTLTTELRHVSGEEVASEYPLFPAKQNDPQALGACLTYARRYSLMAIVGLAPEDDDGNQASGRGEDTGPKAPWRSSTNPLGALANSPPPPSVVSVASLPQVVAKPTDSKVTPGQVTQMQIAIKKLDLPGATPDERRDAKIKWLCKVLDRSVTSTSDVLASEYATVIAAVTK